MSKIVLRPVAITGLSIRYARDMGNNTVRHYCVPHMFLVMTKADPKHVISEYIKINEPEISEVEFADRITPYSDTKQDTHTGSALQVRDVTENVLGKNPEIKKALQQFKGTTIIHQSTYYSSVLDKILDKVQDKFTELKLTLIDGYERYVVEGVALTNNIFTKKEGSGVHFAIFNRRVKRKFTPCSYLSYSYDDDCEAEANEALLLDLHLLNQRGLIMGHLAMPSSLELADTIGIGPMPKALFCFLYIDHDKLADQLGKQRNDLPSNPLTLISINSAVPEGGIGPRISKRPMPTIEEVSVVDGMQEMNQKIVQENYESSRKHVNHVADAMRKHMKVVEYEVSSEVLPLHTNEDGKIVNQVAVNIKKKE